MPSSPPDQTPVAVGRGEVLALLAILAAALALRLPGLGGPLWYDEILTLVTHVRLPWGEMMREYSMNHHYLYSFAAKLSVDAFGESAVALRLPALVFGVLGVWAAWWITRPFAGGVVALLTAALVATSFHHIWFSQNARGYTELAVFCTLGAGLWLRGLSDPRPAVWAAFAATLVLAIVTHLTGAFFFLALGLVWLGIAVTDAGRTRGLLLWPLLAFAGGLLLTVAAYSPVFPSLLATVGSVGQTSAVDAVPQYTNPLWTIAEALRTALGDAGPLLAGAGLVVLGLSIVGARAGGTDGRRLGIVVLVHIVVTMALLKAVGMRIWPRFFFPDIALLLALLALGVVTLARWVGALIGGERLGQAAVWTGAAGMVAVSLVLAARNYTAPKQDLEGAIAVANADPRPGERIYAAGYAGTAYQDYFRTGWARIMTSEDYAQAVAQEGPLTLVVGFPGRTLAAIPAIRDDLDAGRLTQVARLPGTLGDGAVLVLRR